MRLNRSVSKSECPWLDHDLEAGTIVYPYHGYTYGCITPDGTAVSLTAPNRNPFVEVPTNAIEYGDAK